MLASPRADQNPAKVLCSTPAPPTALDSNTRSGLDSTSSALLPQSAVPSLVWAPAQCTRNVRGCWKRSSTTRLPPPDAITSGRRLHVTAGKAVFATVNSQSFGRRAPWRKTRKPPTLGPRSNTAAADTNATPDTSSPAIRLASIAVRAISPAPTGSLVCLRHFIGRDLCRSAFPAPDRESARRSRAGRPDHAGAVPAPAATAQRLRQRAHGPVAQEPDQTAPGAGGSSRRTSSSTTEQVLPSGTVSRLLASQILPFLSHMQQHLFVSLTNHPGWRNTVASISGSERHAGTVARLSYR